MKTFYIVLGLIMAGYLFMLGMGAAYVIDELIEIERANPIHIEKTREWYC